MHTIESAHPGPELRPYVRAYAQRRAHIPNAPLISRVPARLEQILEFQFANSFDVHFDDGTRIATPRIAVIGPQTHLRASVEMAGNIDSFGVFFQPAGLSRVFGVPMRMLANLGHDAASVLGQRIYSVWNELGETNSFPSRVAIIERFLLQSAKIVHPHHRTIDVRMMDTSNRLLAVQGQIAISEVARQHGMGLRHFERTFAQHVGCTPKLYARIARFQTALDLKVASPWMNWLEISHALGYFDQMHMIHDFKSLGGNSPARVLEHLGDMRPEALASSFLENSEPSRIFTMRRSKDGRIVQAS